MTEVQLANDRAATCRTIQPAEDIEQRRLATSARADNADHFASADCDIKSLQRLYFHRRAILLIQVIDLYQVFTKDQRFIHNHNVVWAANPPYVVSPNLIAWKIFILRSSAESVLNATRKRTMNNP